MTETTINKKEIDNINIFSSEIINDDNINIFESLVCKTDKLKLLYRTTRDGNDRESIQNKIINHSNLIVLVRTIENKIFGGYTSLKIEYPSGIGSCKIDNKSFLFSIDLNEKFKIKEDEIAIHDYKNYGLNFGYDDLVIYSITKSDLT